jgi:3-hydroxyisobutyrate dehydrogenase
MAKIGFIGLGNMGGPMAENLLKAGHDLQVFDLVQASVDKAVAAGATAVASVADAVKGVEIVITMLPAGPHVRKVFTEEGALANAAKGTLFIDCSTIGLRRHGGRGGRDPGLHGRWHGIGLRPGGADLREDGQGGDPCRRRRQRASRQDLQ